MTEDWQPKWYAYFLSSLDLDNSKIMDIFHPQQHTNKYVCVTSNGLALLATLALISINEFQLGTILLRAGRLSPTVNKLEDDV